MTQIADFAQFDFTGIEEYRESFLVNVNEELTKDEEDRRCPQFNIPCDEMTTMCHMGCVLGKK